MTLVRIQVRWDPVLIELDHEFNLLMRRQEVKTIGMATRPRRINSHVQPVHFEDFDGHQFERLVFAYCLLGDDANVEWLGEAGGDDGCDIRSEANDGKVTVVLCANYKRLTFRKVSADLGKAAKLDPKPDKIHIVAGGIVSADLREKIKAEAKRLGFRNPKVWSGKELEEHVRRDGPHLLERLVYGEEFPATAEELKVLARNQAALIAIPVTVVDFDPENLSDDAKRLLFEMSNDTDGNLLRTRSHSGYCLTIARHEFVSDTMERRVIARWERAINELLEHNLIENEGTGDALLAVTADGYDALDNCGLIP